ncbi:phage tail protein [Streptococcus lutetiensis]|uniref:phage tail spike protein n=1 Tax=Streptococcus lutetiensis TaxID=150055 RepID=UPI001BD940A9|nr:phage tail spike protein [Streptococcus lutetiensis]MBT0905740.1 phage tail protein [Streptococcus lutetiensis]
MFLTIHDAHLKKVAFIDNEKQGTLSFYDDTWTRNLQTGSSTYEFSISKKTLVSDTVLNRTYSYLNERAFVSFEYKGETFLFNVMTVEEDEKKIKCYCENLNLELINEYSNPFKADRAMSFVEYCNAMDLLNMTKLSIGINEISDYKRTLEWEGQDTKLARLISLANKFDAEIDFKTYLNDDSTIKQFLVNVYHENDGINYHGVGRDRKDITLVYGKNLKSIKRKVDKTNIFNMIVPTAQSEENSDQKLTIGSLPNWELKNDKGIVEFYKRGNAIYAPISAQLYPSTFTSETQSDQWIRHDMDFNVKSIQQLETEGLKQLKASAYPELTYEFDGYIDADIGDTVQLSDDGFANILLIEARIFEQKLSFSTKKNWKTTLGNFRALQSKLSNDIQSELERLVEDAKPYNIRISTDNGTMFKNNEGESLVKATLWKGGKVVSRDVSWRWALDGVVTVGMQYLARAENIDGTAVLTVSAYIGNNEVATTEITLTNVNDGAKGDKGDRGETGPRGPKGEQGIAGATGATGAQGPKGADGKTSYIHIKYSPVPIPKDSQITDTPNAYIGVYTDYNPNDSNKASAYTWSKWQGEDGAQGVQGPKGTDGKTSYIHFAYANSADGKTNFSTTYFSGALYVGTLTDYNSADSTTYSAYTWSRLKGDKGDKGDRGETGPRGPKGEQGIAGATGATGAQGPKGADGKTSYIHIKYSPVPIPKDSQITDTPNAYIGVYTDYNPNDSNKASAYTWSKWQGEDGAQGVQGPKGTDGKTSYIHFAYANSADGKTNFSTTYFSGALYVGTLTDYNSADSTTYSAYTWSRLKGDKGDKGDRGETGERGPQGIQGLQGPKGDQGIQGPKGADGKTQYTHIAYANDATGGGFSQTDQTKAYIGMYVDFNATDSNDPTKYRWSKWHGDKGATGAQGIQGPKGADGRTPYLHIAYANSADGRTGFSTSNTDNKRYLGTYTDYTQADSTDPTKYKWVDMIGSVEVSGRNLWIQSKATGGFVEETLPDNHITGQKKCYRIPNNQELTFNVEPDFSSRLYREVTFSAWVKYENVVQGTNSWNRFNCFKHTLYCKNSSTGATTDATPLTLGDFVGTSDWKYVTYTYDYAAIKSYDQLKTTIRFNLEGAKSGTAWVTGVMVQFGNVATGHVWAPEDIQADIDSKADQTLTQEQLNALEAKRLQMETEMKAKATLEQVSELETFVNNLKKEDLDGRQKIIEITKAIEERVKDIEPIMEYSQKLKFMDTYITQGNGGMIIGKNDGSTKVVVTPDRISFQSGGSEVAYISQSMLHIDNGVFTLSLQLGHYITRVHPKNEYVNGTYFVK